MNAQAGTMMPVLLGLLLTACATPDRVAPGTSAADVRARFGAPSAVYTVPAGTRLAYVRGPLGQETYMVDVGPDDRVLGAAQVLTDDSFARIRIGVDNQDSILRSFGPPAEMRTYWLTGLTEWSYRYRQFGNVPALMGVYFDAQGIVRKTQTGPDPKFDANHRDPRD
jgi:hypothetical protein